MSRASGCAACAHDYASSGERREHETVCQRVRRKAPEWWQKEPGFFKREELPRELRSPARLPCAGTKHNGPSPDCAAVWRDTWQLVQTVNGRNGRNGRKSHD